MTNIKNWQDYKFQKNQNNGYANLAMDLFLIGQLETRYRCKALEELINLNMSVVIKIAKNYTWCNIPFEDLKAYGIEGIIAAADNFDVKSGNKFTTLAYHYVLGRIRRAIEQYNHTIKIPAHVNLARLKIQHIDPNTDVSDEEFTKVRNLFRREKNQSLLTNREALEEVARIIGSRVPVKKEEVVEESAKPSEDVFDIAEDYKLYDFIKEMDPSNAERNLILFKKYRSMGYRVSTALDRVRKVGELREFCNANDIPIELATRCINVYPNLEDAKRELLEWKREGKFGLEADVLPIHSSGTGVEANPVVEYDGRKIKLKRFLNYL